MACDSSGMDPRRRVRLRRPGLVHLTLPVLCCLSAVLAFSDSLGLMYLRFPDLSIHLWGAEKESEGILVFASSLVVVVLLFAAICSVFVFAGGALGHLFTKLPALKAYGADLAGSLFGIAAIAMITAMATSPPWWFAVGSLPFLYLSRRVLSAIGFVGILVFTAISVNGAVFSPYNRIDIEEEDGEPLKISVNRDFHQYMHDLSDARLAEAKHPPLSERKLPFCPGNCLPSKGRSHTRHPGTQ